MSNAALDKLIWTLIFGGLLVVSLGAFALERDGSLGWGLIVAGALGAAVGAGLIFVRSRRADE